MSVPDEGYPDVVEIVITFRPKTEFFVSQLEVVVCLHPG